MKCQVASYLNKLLLIVIFTMVALTCININKVEAHPALLDVYYENPETATGAWYYLTSQENGCVHFDGSTIKYAFGNETNNSKWFWSNSYYTEAEVATLKNSVVRSMKKWEDIRIGKIVNGEPVKSKLINFAEGSFDDYNLLILPDQECGTMVAGIMDIPMTRTVIEEYHAHAEKFWMYLMMPVLGLMKDYDDPSEYNVALERVGAHEFGHVLGLLDVDDVEHGDADYDWEHSDKIMGYATYGEYTEYQTFIGFYDFMGAAITRGLHTENDHKWRVEGTKGDLTVLECYLCNGRIDVAQNADGTYGPNNLTAITKRASCTSTQHTYSSSTMVYVGSSSSSDFFKCQHCDYYRMYTHYVGGAYHFGLNGHYQDCNYCGEKIYGEHEYVQEELYYVCTICNYRTRIRTISTADGETLYAFSDDASEGIYNYNQAQNYIWDNNNYDITEKIEVLEEISNA